MLVDSFKYHEYLEVDRNHAPKYGPEKAIQYVRIDRSTVYTRNNGESIKRADATIYCYLAHTAPFEKFVLQSKVSFDGESFTVTDVRAMSEPFENVITAYELEVVR